MLLIRNFLLYLLFLHHFILKRFTNHLPINRFRSRLIINRWRIDILKVRFLITFLMISLVIMVLYAGLFTLDAVLLFIGFGWFFYALVVGLVGGFEGLLGWVFVWFGGILIVDFFCFWFVFRCVDGCLFIFGGFFTGFAIGLFGVYWIISFLFFFSGKFGDIGGDIIFFLFRSG